MASELANFFESSRKWFKNDDDFKCSAKIEEVHVE